MKNAHFEKLGRLLRQYHRNHPWRLSQGGLYVPHLYENKDTDRLSWWDDVGFILNRRRVIVWWRHPRDLYSGAIKDEAYRRVGPSPGDNWVTEGSTPNYRKVGKSRKKIVTYTCRQPSAEQQAYYDKLHETEARLASEGIDFEVGVSWRRERLNWATGVELVAPFEVRNETELAVVAEFARRLVLGQSTLGTEFPGYRYGKADWLKEAGKRK